MALAISRLRELPDRILVDVAIISTLALLSFANRREYGSRPLRRLRQLYAYETAKRIGEWPPA